MPKRKRPDMYAKPFRWRYALSCEYTVGDVLQLGPVTGGRVNLKSLDDLERIEALRWRVVNKLAEERARSDRLAKKFNRNYEKVILVGPENVIEVTGNRDLSTILDTKINPKPTKVSALHRLAYESTVDLSKGQKLARSALQSNGYWQWLRRAHTMLNRVLAVAMIKSLVESAKPKAKLPFRSWFTINDRRYLLTRDIALNDAYSDDIAAWPVPGEVEYELVE